MPRAFFLLSGQRAGSSHGLEQTNSEEKKSANGLRNPLDCSDFFAHSR